MKLLTRRFGAHATHPNTILCLTFRADPFTI